MTTGLETETGLEGAAAVTAASDASPSPRCACGPDPTPRASAAAAMAAATCARVEEVRFILAGGCCAWPPGGFRGCGDFRAPSSGPTRMGDTERAGSAAVGSMLPYKRRAGHPNVRERSMPTWLRLTTGS